MTPLQIIIAVCITYCAVMGLVNAFAGSSMSPAEHRSEALRNAKIAANSTSKRTIVNRTAVAQSHLIAAEEEEVWTP